MDTPSENSVSHQTFEAAAALMTSRVPRASTGDTAGEIRQSLVRERFDTVSEIVVCDGERLVGLIRIEDVMPADDDVRAIDILDANPPVVRPGVDQEVAAWQATQRDQSSLAVVDEAGGFLGMIPPQRLLRVLLEEHEEDMARLGGFLQGVSSARTAAEEAISLRFLHRLPWLLVGLAGAFLAASIITSFEQQLRGNITLLFFIPSVVYMADAVGTQTETIVIRGLSVGVPIRRIVQRELFTGVLVGIAISLAFLPLALWWWGESDIALVVTLALMAACSVATFIAMALPWLFHRLGSDPAFGSGPLATVIQDLLSVTIYLVIAVLVVGSSG
jgi:magnesium transporter